ncbi:hypothetical protein BDZ91DRAFT_732608 [Kalaharituber pfeilii]|nr:hypothetical protein BDZ91DRAFT_732608 [Kalaharituber pfeilii]
MNHGNGATYSSQEQSNSGGFGDMDSFLDLDIYPFSNPSSANSSSTNLSRTSSAQPVIQPSFPYDLYPQTVPPPVLSADFLPELTPGASSSITMSPDLLDMDAQLNAMMPPYFFPEERGGTVDPSSIMNANSIAPAHEGDVKYIPQPPPRFDGKRLYAGIHTQRAAYNKDLENQRRLAEAQAKKATAAAAAAAAAAAPGNTPKDMDIDQRINAVLNRMKPPKIVPSAPSPSSILPHIARMKKDEEEMDEDERLLASEEGKKLSSKERRQLRNKVSARAFRSRRKEYISQLEAEVANKTSEAAELRAENTTLKSEIAQLQEFTRSVLRSPAFSSFLAELEKSQAAATAAAETPAPPAPEPAPNYHKDPNPNMINLANDDWALAYGPVAGAPMWATTPQVYSVFDLPQGPANLQDLSGKVTKPAAEDFIDWSSFPPPADGFSPNFNDSKQSRLPTLREEEECDSSLYDMDVAPEESEYEAPENLADLYESKPGKISERIEAIAPGVGLDMLLGRLEMVINGEADASDFFDVPAMAAAETGEVAQEGDKMEMEEDAEQYRERCRDVARMFDVVETYKRVGAVVGI